MQLNKVIYNVDRLLRHGSRLKQRLVNFSVVNILTLINKIGSLFPLHSGFFGVFFLVHVSLL